MTDLHGGHGGKTCAVDRQKEPESSQIKDWTLSEGKLLGEVKGTTQGSC